MQIDATFIVESLKRVGSETTLTRRCPETARSGGPRTMNHITTIQITGACAQRIEFVTADKYRGMIRRNESGHDKVLADERFDNADDELRAAVDRSEPQTLYEEALFGRLFTTGVYNRRDILHDIGVTDAALRHPGFLEGATQQFDTTIRSFRGGRSSWLALFCLR